MRLFDSYLNSIAEIIKEKQQVKSFSEYAADSKIPRYFEKSYLTETAGLQRSNERNKVLIEFDNSQLTRLFGPNPNSFNETTIGSHPDFEDLGYHEYVNHYCVSMFMDIKGSTRLNEKYNLIQIRKIKDTVLTLAIHIASHFGAHIHRLQGDGIFLQFVRKEQKEEDAVINALNAASILTHFISTDLARILDNEGVKPLRVRIGIDLGYKDDVIWSHYGIPGCSELTTTSLHTDLAAKLQAKAESNGILVGSNIKDILDIKDEFCQTCHENGETDYYIYQGFINYKKYKFNWLNYLNTFDFTIRNSHTLEINEPNIKLICKIYKPYSENPIEYFQNSAAIDKEYNIRYEIMENEHKYFKKDWETIEWKAVNSGEEAKEAGQLNHDFEKKYVDSIFCETKAAYLGHHHVECTIKRRHSENIKLKFPIFVK